MGNAAAKKSDIPENLLHVQGLYPRCDWEERTVRKLILSKHLAPCYPGATDNGEGDPSHVECPICMLTYPLTNRCSCCKQPICTECYLQIRKPKSPSVTCPYCNAPSFSAEFRGPKSREEIEAEEVERQKVIAARIRAQREEEEEDAKRRRLKEACLSITPPPARAVPDSHTPPPVQPAMPPMAPGDLEEWMLREAIRQSLAGEREGGEGEADTDLALALAMSLAANRIV